jgi:hypothetical protein
MSTNRNTPGPILDGDEFDWRFVGEPESWMGLRSERAMALRPAGITAGEPQAGRLAARLIRSFLSLIRG